MKGLRSAGRVAKATVRTLENRITYLCHMRIAQDVGTHKEIDRQIANCYRQLLVWDVRSEELNDEKTC